MDIEKFIDRLSELFYYISGSSLYEEVLLKFFALFFICALASYTSIAFIYIFQRSKNLNEVWASFACVLIGILLLWRGSIYMFGKSDSLQAVLECPLSLATENQMTNFQSEFKHLKQRADGDNAKAAQAVRSLFSTVSARLAVDVPSTNGATNKTSALKCLIAMEKEGDLDAGSAKKAFNDNNADEQNMAWMVDRLVDKTKKEPKDFKLWRENLYARANAIQDTETLENLDYIDRNYPINIGNGGSQ